MNLQEFAGKTSTLDTSKYQISTIIKSRVLNIRLKVYDMKLWKCINEFNCSDIHLNINLSVIKKPNVFNGHWKKCQMHKTVTNCVNKLQTKDKGRRTSRETAITVGSWCFSIPFDVLVFFASSQVSCIKDDQTES